MNSRTGRLEIRSLLGGMVLVSIVAIGVGLAGCESQFAGAELAIPLDHSGYPRSSYVKGLSYAALDENRLALAWVEETRTHGDGLWVCTVSRDPTGVLRVATDPERVDTRSISDAAVVSSGGSFGLVYIKLGELYYRWPWNGPPQMLNTRIGQGVYRSTAIADSAVGNIAFARISQLQGGKKPTIELVGYALSPNGSTLSRIAEIDIPTSRILQPPPRAFLNGTGVDVAMVIAGGRLANAAAPVESLRTIPGSAGELVVLGLSLAAEHRLRIDRLERFALPAERELEHMSDFVVLDTSPRAIATASRIVRLISFADDSARIEQLSSMTGCGEMYSSPTVQALSTSDSEVLVTWIDTEKELKHMSLSNEGYNPTVYGGEIRARWVTRSGEVLSKRVSGFPIRTVAQCIRMGTLDGQPFIAWAEASPHSSSGDRPEPAALRVRLLGATQGR